MTATPVRFIHTETGETLTLDVRAARKLKRGTKIARILEVFARGHALNRFEAERLGDHTLPQTVDALQRRCGLRFTRHVEAVRGFTGGEARCVRYWLDVAQRQRAREALP